MRIIGELAESQGAWIHSILQRPITDGNGGVMQAVAGGGSFVQAHWTGGVHTVHTSVRAYYPRVLERNKQGEKCVNFILINKIMI